MNYDNALAFFARARADDVSDVIRILCAMAAASTRRRAKAYQRMLPRCSRGAEGHGAWSMPELSRRGPEK